MVVTGGFIFVGMFCWMIETFLAFFIWLFPCCCSWCVKKEEEEEVVDDEEVMGQTQDALFPSLSPPPHPPP